MKGFNRKNQLFSLCGLNCGLCPMFLNKYCPGCGGGEGNQSCKIARCSMEHNGVEYCFQCDEYPCPKYEHMDDFDSFMTHQGRKSDMERARQLGIEAYNAEQMEKTKIMDILLSDFNDGRKKTLFCTAVSLLDLQDPVSYTHLVVGRLGLCHIRQQHDGDGIGQCGRKKDEGQGHAGEHAVYA